MAETLEAELAAHSGRKVSKLTLGLTAGVVLVAGVLIGIQGQKAFGATTTASVPQTRQQGQGPGMAMGNRQGGMRGDMTMGTVEKIDGNKIHLKSMDGSTIVVTTTDATKVQVSKEGKVSDLAAGGSVVVQGAKAADGSVSATTVTQSAQGGGPR